MSVNMKQSGNLIPIASLTKAIIPLGIGDCYSTEERQVGCWTDGKPLYQKTIYIPSVTSGSSYNHGISNVENIFIHDIKAKRNTGWFSSGHVFEDSPANITESFSIIPSATSLYVYLYGCTISECSVTVRYTKTTDTAGSGIWTPSGAQAAHYSTTEQVVGDYMGDPLYGRITDNIGVSVANTSWTQVASIPNGKDIINLTVWTYFNEYALINYNQVQLDSTTGNLYVRFTSDVVGRTVYRIYAEYTKTV